MEMNAEIQRFSATLNIGTIGVASTADVTFALAGSSAAPGAVAEVATTAHGVAVPGDAVLLFPKATMAVGIGVLQAQVTAAGVITARFTNPTSATIAAGTAVAFEGILIKGRGSI